jgi:hypothetical protein
MGVSTQVCGVTLSYRIYYWIKFLDAGLITITHGAAKKRTSNRGPVFLMRIPAYYWVLSVVKAFLSKFLD